MSPISHGFRLRLKAGQGSHCQRTQTSQGQRGRAEGDMLYTIKIKQHKSTQGMSFLMTQL